MVLVVGAVAVMGAEDVGGVGVAPGLGAGGLGSEAAVVVAVAGGGPGGGGGKPSSA